MHANPNDWFSQAAGRCLLDAQTPVLHELLQQRPAQPWLWLAPQPCELAALPARGWQMCWDGRHWQGAWRWAQALPLASESLGTIILQHTPGSLDDNAQLLAECARALLPGGRLCVMALNPLSPYRLRWRGHGLHAAEPLSWRKRLREHGLSPEAVSLGIGPTWRQGAGNTPQQGAGLRAAYLICADKRRIPLTPIRQRAQRLAHAAALAALAHQRRHDENLAPDETR